MYVRSLSLTDFRNIEKLSLTFTPNFNIIFGNNAQGKTNTVEAICLALSGKSHRENLNANFIRFGQEACLVNAEVSCDDFTTVNSKVNVGSKGRTHFIDSERVRSSQTLLSFFSYVFFSPEDLRLVKDSPVLRRNFTDESISVLYPSYAKLTGRGIGAGISKYLVQENYEQITDCEEKVTAFLKIYHSIPEYVVSISSYKKKSPQHISILGRGSLIY